MTALHATALRVLQELGIRILYAEAREVLCAAGARIKGEDMVHIGADMVSEALRTAPRRWRMRAINPVREQWVEEGAMMFFPAGGCPNVTDLERGRRPGSLASYTEALILQQSFDAIHHFSPAPEPQDVPVHLRHYATQRLQMTMGDKPMTVYARGRAQVMQSFEMIQLGFGLTDAEFRDGAWASTVINTNSPRMIDVPMAQGILDFARAGQMLIITPFCLAGAMAPITVAGALVLQHAEALAGITLAQMASPGAPVMYGGFSSNVDMKSGAPAFGTPEHLKMQLGAGQLARHIGLPWRSAAGSAGVTNDMQSAQEAANGIWGGAMANATILIHAAGWLEGGLTFGFEKFINDMEVLHTLAEMATPVEATAAGMGFDAIAAVEPGGHFFAGHHTMERYRDAFYPPLVADLGNYGGWIESGSVTSDQRATAIWKDVLAHHRPAAQAEDVHERITPWIEARSREGGAPVVE